MKIVLFKDITTEDILNSLEKDGKKYQGLYVDMDNKEERKYVKDNAQLIGDLLKKLDRARIEKARDFKKEVEKEAAEIKGRLEEANRPFTLLIDEHKAKRAKILAEKKAKEEAIKLAIQIEQEHASAILEDKVRTIEKTEREKAQKEHEEKIAKQAREQAEKQAVIDAQRAVEEERERVRKQELAVEIERQKRESNRNHVSKIRKQTKESLMLIGLDEDTAKRVVLAINSGKIKNVKITY